MCILRRSVWLFLENEGPGSRGQLRRYRWWFQPVERRAGVPIHPATQSPKPGTHFRLLFPYGPHLLHWSLLFIFKTHMQSEHVSPPSPQPSVSKPLSFLAWPMIMASQMALLQPLPHTAAKSALKSINQNLSPTWLKTLNGFPVHLKSKHCTIYMYMWLWIYFTWVPTSLPASLMAFHRPVTLVCFCSLNLFCLFLPQDLCTSSFPDSDLDVLSCYHFL